jgi:hypothetical protein
MDSNPLRPGHALASPTSPEERGVLVVQRRLYEVGGENLAEERREKARALREGGEEDRQDG